MDLDNGSSATYDPRRLRGVNVYRETTRELATGDRIEFTAPDKDLGVANRDLGTVTSLEDGKIAVRLEGKERCAVTFDLNEYRQFGHVYAVTSHSSQGLTAGWVIVNIDTFSSGVMPQLLSAPLQIGIRFLRLPLPTAPIARLTATPAQQGSASGLPCSV